MTEHGSAEADGPAAVADLRRLASNGPDSMGREIGEGPAAVEATLAGLADGVAARVVAGAERVVLVGTGASFAMVEAAAPFFAGPPAIARESSSLAFGDLDGQRHRPGDIVVAVSMSGESPETRAAATASQRAGARVLAITSVADSGLARSADDVILTPIGTESGAATKSALSAFAALAALAGALPADAEATVGLSHRLTVTASDVVSILDGGARVGRARSCWTLGFGPAFGVARAAALLLHEKARRPAVPCTPSEFRHGPIEAAGPEDAVVLVDAGLGPNAARARYLDRLGGELGALRVPIVSLRRTGDGPESILHALLWIQQLGRVAAMARGTYREEFLVLRAVVHAADDLVDSSHGAAGPGD